MGEVGACMIERALSAYLGQLLAWFPVVSVTGPRQSGKSTLVKASFPDFAYENLEDPQTFARASEDPVGFVRNRPDHLIVDEAQRVPELFSAIQVESDRRGTSGQYVLSGPQNFLLLRQISQSLAGRVGMARLLPLSFAELKTAHGDATLNDFLFTGGYPRMYDVGIPPLAYFPNYVETYVARDVVGYLDVRKAAAFRTFLELCAQSAGRLVNLTRLASDAGVSRDTARSWLSILQSSYVVFLLEPYHANLRKRLTKTPKLYFHDTGLLCHLLRIQSAQQLLTSSQLGTVFENLMVEETLKRHMNAGREPRLYFYRDDEKREVDLVDMTVAGAEELVEIKASETFRPSFCRHLGLVGDLLGIPAERRFVVERAEGDFGSGGVQVRNASGWLVRP